MDTLRSFKRFGAKGVYRQMSCRGIARQSAVLYRLLTETIQAPKKRNRTVRVTNTLTGKGLFNMISYIREGGGSGKYARKCGLVYYM